MLFINFFDLISTIPNFSTNSLIDIFFSQMTKIYKNIFRNLLGSIGLSFINLVHYNLSCGHIVPPSRLDRIKITKRFDLLFMCKIKIFNKTSIMKNIWTSVFEFMRWYKVVWKNRLITMRSQSNFFYVVWLLLLLLSWMLMLSWMFMLYFS